MIDDEFGRDGCLLSTLIGGLVEEVGVVSSWEVEAAASRY
jgi:hypothetical protein